MNLQFTFRKATTEQQIQICYDYYCPDLEKNLSLGEHIETVCQTHQITLVELANVIKKTQVHHPEICCKKCNVMFKIDQPYFDNIEGWLSYICDNCASFIQGN